MYICESWYLPDYRCCPPHSNKFQGLCFAVYHPTLGWNLADSLRNKGPTTFKDERENDPSRIQDFQRGVVDVDSCCLVLPDRIFLENQKDGIPKLFHSFSSHPYLFLLRNHKSNPLKGGFHDLEHAGGASALTMRGIMRVSLWLS